MEVAEKLKEKAEAKVQVKARESQEGTAEEENMKECMSCILLAVVQPPTASLLPSSDLFPLHRQRLNDGPAICTVA